jgi:AraC-like DNA-binding protein
MKKLEHRGFLPLGSAGQCGINTPHREDEIADYWLKDRYVLMQFHTPFEAETIHGRVRGKPGQMMINSPDFHHWHRGLDGEGFRNDWIHIKKEDGKKYMSWLKLPCNEIFSVSLTDFFGEKVRSIQHERLGYAPRSQEIMAGCVRELFLLIDRYRLMAQRQASSPIEQEHYEKLCHIRSRMQSHFEGPWDVASMAQEVHLSPNRFSVLYRKFFNISPIEDLIQRRVEEAKILLLRRRLSIAEVADKIGFANPNYFSRLFQARTGTPPSLYGSP